MSTLLLSLIRSAAPALVGASALLASWAPAAAIEIELLGDVATDRVERQRAYARGNVPLPGTPDVAHLDERLAAKGLTLGSAIFLRIFKASSELELWMQKGDTFTLLDVYPVCHWTGTLGPKLREGDKQSPEGFYSVADRQMRLFGRWPQAFNLGFPNAYDKANRRTGSHILVHGGCSSTGCFAMTETVQQEIRALAEAALKNGQARFHVHVFPFRMTDENMAAWSEHPWIGFWRDLKAGYDTFERTHVPPRVAVCQNRYHVSDGEPASKGEATPLAPIRPGIARNGDGKHACPRPAPASVATAAATQSTPTMVVPLGAVVPAVAAGQGRTTAPRRRARVVAQPPVLVPPPAVIAAPPRVTRVQHRAIASPRAAAMPRSVAMPPTVAVPVPQQVKGRVRAQVPRAVRGSGRGGAARAVDPGEKAGAAFGSRIDGSPRVSTQGG